MKFFLAQDYALYSELHKRKGELPKAREKLDRAIHIFKECSSDGWIEKYEKDQASLS